MIRGKLLIFILIFYIFGVFQAIFAASKAKGLNLKKNMVPKESVISNENTTLDGNTGPKKNIALIIGNSEYYNVPGLGREPENDAEEMANTLKEMGYEIIKIIDGTYNDIVNGLEEFYKKLTYTELGIFYFAGHGISINGINYILSVDFSLNDHKNKKPNEKISLPNIIKKMENSRPKNILIFLDACRENNPFVTQNIGDDLMLEQTKTNRSGYLISYATDLYNDNTLYTSHPVTNEKDETFNNNKKNGYYTNSLVKEIKINENLEKHKRRTIDGILQLVRKDVSDDTDGNQNPFYGSLLNGEVYLGNERGVINIIEIISDYYSKIYIDKNKFEHIKIDEVIKPDDKDDGGIKGIVQLDAKDREKVEIDVRYPNNAIESNTLYLKPERTLAIEYKNKETGHLDIKTINKGTIHLNNEEYAKIKDNGRLIATNINTGDYEVKIVYENGDNDKKKVSVSNGETRYISFDKNITSEDMKKNPINISRKRIVNKSDIRIGSGYIVGGVFMAVVGGLLYGTGMVGLVFSSIYISDYSLLSLPLAFSISYGLIGGVTLGLCSIPLFFKSYYYLASSNSPSLNIGFAVKKATLTKEETYNIDLSFSMSL